LLMQSARQRLARKINQARQSQLIASQLVN